MHARGSSHAYGRRKRVISREPRKHSIRRSNLESGQCGTVVYLQTSEQTVRYRARRIGPLGPGLQFRCTTGRTYSILAAHTTPPPRSPRAFKIRVHTVRWHRAFSKLQAQRDRRAPFADVWARLPARGPAGEHASERTPSGRLPCPGKARAARRADSGRRRQSRASTCGPATD